MFFGVFLLYKYFRVYPVSHLKNYTIDLNVFQEPIYCGKRTIGVIYFSLKSLILDDDRLQWGKSDPKVIELTLN